MGRPRSTFATTLVSPFFSFLPLFIASKLTWHWAQKHYPQNPLCEELAKYVANIQGACTNINDSNEHFSCGQQFDTGELNLVLKRTIPGVACVKPAFDCVEASTW